MTDKPMSREDAIPFVAQIVAAHLASTPTKAGDLPALIKSVHETILDIAKEPPSAFVHPAADPSVIPAQRVEMTVHREHLDCLECGRPIKLLRSHLRDTHGMTVNEYLARWWLPHDYPTTPEAYVETRRAVANRIGLGRHQGTRASYPPAEPKLEKPKRPRGRPRKHPLPEPTG